MPQELQLTEQEQIRRQKMQDLIDKGIDPFGSKFVRTANSQELKDKYASFSKEELLEMNVEASVAGRIMTKRCKGKVGFMHIQDRYGQLQIYLRYDLCFFLSFFTGSVSRMTFLPQEFRCTEERTSTHFPSHYITPLVAQQGQVAPRVNPILVSVPYNRFRSRTDN